MHQISTAGRSYLAGSAVAELLIEYAALVAQIRGGDAVPVRVIGVEGDEVVATFLLNPGSMMTIETARTEAAEPDNAETEAYLRERIASYGPAHDLGGPWDRE